VGFTEELVVSSYEVIRAVFNVACWPVGIQCMAMWNTASLLFCHEV